MYLYRIWFSLWLNNCLKRRMITLKQITFVLDWTVVIVYEIREVVMHYLFNRSPENTFTLRFSIRWFIGESERTERERTAKKTKICNCKGTIKSLGLPWNTCFSTFTIKRQPFVHKHMKSGKQNELWPNFLQKAILLPIEKSFDQRGIWRIFWKRLSMRVSTVH